MAMSGGWLSQVRAHDRMRRIAVQLQPFRLFYGYCILFGFLKPFFDVCPAKRAAGWAKWRFLAYGRETDERQHMKRMLDI